MQLCYSQFDYLLISESVAFRAALTHYSSLPNEAVVKFDAVLLNEGGG